MATKTLYQKILTIYPALTSADFNPTSGTIVLRNDGTGDYIKAWTHPTYTKPTQAQLDAVI